MVTAVIDRPLQKAEVVWKAQPRQRVFLRREEDEVLYGGAAGGGKTDALLIYGIRSCLKNPNSAALFLRRTFADLNKPKAAIPRSHELLAGTGAAWNGQDHRWTFPNGAVLQFGHLQHDIDVYAYQGAQVDALLWDELTQFTEEQYDFLTTRVRATVEGLKPAVRGATNPGGVGHAWVKARWIEAGPAEEPFALLDRETKVQTGTGVFIPAKVQDNQELLKRDPGYPDRLRRLPEMLRRAYLEGDWDIFSGQYFSMWRAKADGEPWHVWPEWDLRQLYEVGDEAHFPPRDWLHWGGIDGGTRDPWVWLSAVRAPNRRVIVYREEGGPGIQVPDQARHIKQVTARERERFERLLADPAMFATRANLSVSDAQVYDREGVPLVRGNNNRRQGWRRIAEMLTDVLDDGYPQLVVMESGCPNLIRTLPQLLADEIDHEDVSDKHGRYDPMDSRAIRDDWGDALRYLVTPAAAPNAETRTHTVSARFDATQEAPRYGSSGDYEPALNQTGNSGVWR